MSYIEIIILAFVLSVDVFVVSFSYGLCLDKHKRLNALLLASFTGSFQGIMPFIGYFLTGMVRTYILPYSKIIIFLIFAYLGVKFIIESFEEKKCDNFCIGLKCLILIGIATSIDAFSAGISLSLSGNKILKPSFLIACITFIDSCAGFLLGNRLKHLPTKYLEISAGLLLIILGVKAFF